MWFLRLTPTPVRRRTGTFTIVGQTLTVTQAGSTYVTANPVIALVQNVGFNCLNGIAVNYAGNVYIPSQYYNDIEEWTVASNSLAWLGLSGFVFSSWRWRWIGLGISI